MKKDISTSNYIDFTFNPLIKFVKSQATFKIKLKLAIGCFSFVYIDFVPRKSQIVNSPIVQELLDYSYLTNSFLNRLSVKNPYYVPIPLSKNKEKKKLEF